MQTYMVGINLVKIRHLHSIAMLSLPCISYTTHGNVETLEADSSSSQRLKTDYITKTVNMFPTVRREDLCPQGTYVIMKDLRYIVMACDANISLWKTPFSC